MRRWVLTILAVAAVTVGCERAGDETAEKIAERALAKSGRESTVELDRERGTIVIDWGDAKRPKRWPEDVPYYPHAQRARAGKREGAAQRLSLRSDDRLVEVAGFYREKLAAGGWKVEFANGRLTASKAGREIVARFEERRPVGGVKAVIDVRDVRG